jgi:hypothetical protein
MNRVARSVELGELVAELALKEFEPFVGRAYHPDLVRPLGDREMLIHPFPVVPNLPEFGGADAEVGEECRFVREFGWNGDANGLAEQRSPIRHEVSLPIIAATHSNTARHDMCRH